MEGMTYRLVPVKASRSDNQTGIEYTDAMFDNLMHKYQFGNINNPDVYLDETNTRMTMNLRSNFSRLATALIAEGKLDSANQVMDRIMIEIPDKIVPYDYFVLPIAEGYFVTGKPEKGAEIFNRIIDIMDEQLNYYFSFTGKHSAKYDFNKQQNLAMLRKIMQVAKSKKQKEIADRATATFDEYYDLYTGQK
jgi:hypothetical protein